MPVDGRLTSSSDKSAGSSTWLIVGLGVGLGLILLGLNFIKFAYLQNVVSFELSVAVAVIVVLAFVFVIRWQTRDQAKKDAAEAAQKGTPASGSEQTARAITVTTEENPVLSMRENQVLEGMCRGETNREIAERLFVSPNTVKTHAANIYSKLGVNRRAQAVHRARELGIIVENGSKTD